MGYVIPDDIDDRITALVASGQFASRDDVLRAAIKALEFRHNEIAAIQAGIDDMDAGRVTSIRDFDRDFRQRNNIL